MGLIPEESQAHVYQHFGSVRCLAVRELSASNSCGNVTCGLTLLARLLLRKVNSIMMGTSMSPLLTDSPLLSGWMWTT
jgi:hypothetical protein